MGADYVETLAMSISGGEVRAIADIDQGRAKIFASRVSGAEALPSAERQTQARRLL
jgi:hypothetical protein